MLFHISLRAANSQEPQSALPAAQAPPYRSLSPEKAQAPQLPDITDIGSGLEIASSAWRRIQTNTKDSMFIKDLLTAVWSPAELLGRSLQGKHCPRFPDRPRKEPLSLWKVSVIRECYKERLQKKGLVAELTPGALKQMNRFIVEKISDIERMAKRFESWLIAWSHFRPER
ncbi:BEN domain-containing protein 5-like [Dermacentor albipictus]|uniref:BEN domain-containing protein 5-like n=1 Tax=Dermacentor albipictus TaxID=60249 RepID=UPI0038FC7538